MEFIKEEIVELLIKDNYISKNDNNFTFKKEFNDQEYIISYYSKDVISIERYFKNLWYDTPNFIYIGYLRNKKDWNNIKDLLQI